MQIRNHITASNAALWIRIRMDPKLLPGSRIIVSDPDPAKNERADIISQYRPGNSGLCVV